MGLEYSADSGAHYYTAGRYKGTKTVAVSPDFSEYVKFADVWLAPQRGTDSALALALGLLPPSQALALLIPTDWLVAIGLVPHRHQILAITTGLLFAVACLAGLVLLMHRRATQPRIRATTRTMDVVVLVWILLTLGFGITTLYFSAQELSGTRLVSLAEWAQHIATFRGGAAELVADVPWVYKIHIVLGMTLFAVIPFSRLIHIWSGFAAVAYLFRPYLVVRPAWPHRNSR